jgi:hypothetical protein
MPQVPSSTPSSTSFEAIFIEAVKTYEKKTKKDLTSHPLAAELRSCNTLNDILAVLRAQAQVLDRSQGADDKLTKWLDPIVNVLCSFSETIGNAVGLVTTPHLSPLEICRLTCTIQAFPPATVIFAGIGVLLQVSERCTRPRMWMLLTDTPLRPLRKSVLADGLSSTFLAASNPFLRDSKYIQGFNQPRPRQRFNQPRPRQRFN